jgi:CBS domain containing-hemolysin-like protein
MRLGPQTSVFLRIVMLNFSLEILVNIVLVTINGLLAMSEIAMVSARKSLLHKRAESGSNGARVALKLLAAPSRFVPTVLVPTHGTRSHHRR